jgi:hypothetical protein
MQRSHSLIQLNWWARWRSQHWCPEAERHEQAVVIIGSRAATHEFQHLIGHGAKPWTAWA